MSHKKYWEVVTDNFIEHVNDYMKKNNLTQKKVADVLHIKESSLSRKLSKKTSLSLDDVDDFSKSLGISRYALLDSGELPDEEILSIKEKLASLTPKQRAYVIEILDSICKLAKLNS